MGLVSMVIRNLLLPRRWSPWVIKAKRGERGGGGIDYWQVFLHEFLCITMSISRVDIMKEGGCTSYNMCWV